MNVMSGKKEAKDIPQQSSGGRIITPERWLQHENPKYSRTNHTVEDKIVPI